jgi:hypothetical protein
MTEMKLNTVEELIDGVVNKECQGSCPGVPE